MENIYLKNDIISNNVSRINFLINNDHIPESLIEKKKIELSLRRILQLYLTNQAVCNEDIKYVNSYIKNNNIESVLLYISNMEKMVLKEISELSFQFTKEKSN